MDGNRKQRQQEKRQRFLVRLSGPPEIDAFHREPHPDHAHRQRRPRVTPPTRLCESFDQRHRRQAGRCTGDRDDQLCDVQWPLAGECADDGQNSGKHDVVSAEASERKRPRFERVPGQSDVAEPV